MLTSCRDATHKLYGTDLPDGHVERLAYIIAPDIFPQSLVYLSAPPDTHLNPQTFTQEVTFLLTRFKPDNIMHVFHDDLLPIYAVLSEFFPDTQAPFPVRLVFADDFGVMPHDGLYQLLSSYDLTYESRGLCFKEVIVGFNKKSLWYHYGFASPQGPVPHNKTYIQHLIHSFKASVPNSTLPQEKNQVLLFSRSESRLILNEAQLTLRLARKLGASVKTLDLEVHSVQKVLAEVSRTSLVVGMHGSMFISLLWAAPNTKVLELFPYAVPHDQYTPYKTLASILDLEYVAWTNTELSHTVGHIDYPREYGGLLHLQSELQEEIVEQKVVPPHLCCDDPSWLYHIYQDTVVNVTQILDLVCK